MCICSTSKEQTQKVIDFGHGPHCRPWILGSRLLFDGDHRTEAGDMFDIRALHIADELAGITGEGLHIPALPFGIDGIKCQT